jgi:hypothetical protein
MNEQRAMPRLAAIYSGKRWQSEQRVNEASEASRGLSLGLSLSPATSKQDTACATMERINTVAGLLNIAMKRSEWLFEAPRHTFS